MPLIDRNGFRPDDWTYWANETSPGAQHRVIVPLRRYLDPLRGNHPELTFGVAIDHASAKSEWDSLTDVLGELSLISIAFPGSGDGTGFSLARRLRRLGFGGELRASGPLIADQFAFALGCGFDCVEVPNAVATRQPEKHWLTALASIDRSYQANYGPGSILERRHSIRSAAAGFA